LSSGNTIVQVYNAYAGYFNGIDATGEGKDISVTTLAGGLVEGVLSGIVSRHYGSGQGLINVYGSVQGGYSGIYAIGEQSVFINNGASVTGGSSGVNGDEASQYLSVAGVISGDMASDLRGGDDTLLLTTGATVTGNLGGGDGTGDAAILEGMGLFDESFLAFETLTMQGVDWDLGGDSAFESVAVDSGRLRINGEVTAPTVAVAPDGILGGDGTVVGAVENDGTLAPGNSVGLLTIEGDFTQSAEGSLEIEIGETGMTDLLVVTGTAQLDGELELVPLNGLLDVNGTVVLQGGTVEGEFAQFTPNGFMTEVVYHPDFVELNVASTPNAAGTSGTNTTGLLSNWLFLDTLGSAAASSGGEQQVRAGDVQTASLTPYTLTGEGKRTLWARTFGQKGHRSQEGAIAPFDFTIAGLAAGGAYRLTENRSLGAALGLSEQTADKEPGLGEDRVDSANLGLFAVYQTETFFATFALEGGLSDYDLERIVQVSGTPTRATGETSGHSLGASIEGGYDFDVGQGFSVVPRGTRAYLSVERDGFTESGLGASNLTFQDASAEALRVAGELAFEHENQVSFGGVPRLFKQELRVGLLHEAALDDRNVGVTNPTLGNGLILGDGSDRTMITFGAGVSLKVTEEATVFFGYDGEYGSGHKAHSVNLRLRFSW
jgi:outer membrane autotransporter protein